MDVAHSSPNIWPQKNVTNYVTKRRKKKTLFIPQREACVTGRENGRKEGRKLRVRVGCHPQERKGGLQKSTQYRTKLSPAPTRNLSYFYRVTGDMPTPSGGYGRVED